MKTITNKFTFTLISIFVFSLSFFAYTKPSDEYSYSERRHLVKCPQLSINSVLSGDFMEDFELYIQDQFPLRDQFRTLKAHSAYTLFNKIENNNIYMKDGYLSKLEYPVNNDMLNYACQLFDQLNNKYFTKNNQLYISIIPDKNYYLTLDSSILSMDYNHLYHTMISKLPYMQYIDIVPLLSIEDYYYTDTHYRQENLIDVSTHLLKQMGHDSSYEYEKVLGTNQFYGVYSGQSALDVKPDSLYYLTNDMMDDYIVKSYSHGKEEVIDLYNFDKLNSKDAYEFYLNGSESLLTIENKNATSSKELIIFRDSFGSSISPLLCEAYSKVTLVDLRYMSSTMLDKYIDFDDQDILFLYSTLVLNNSTSLK